MGSHLGSRKIRVLYVSHIMWPNVIIFHQPRFFSEGNFPKKLSYLLGFLVVWPSQIPLGSIDKSSIVIYLMAYQSETMCTDCI